MNFARSTLSVVAVFGGTSIAYAQDPPPDYSPDPETAHHLHAHHGGMSNLYLEGERLEFRSGEGDPHLLWDAQAWSGGDINKVWIKTEGEFEFAPDTFSEAELQTLYSRAVTPFFDAQLGVRHDLSPDPSRTFAVIGFQGLAPYRFEIDSALFISGRGEVSARVETEYELLLTQRLILQPRSEFNFAAQSASRVGKGSGLSSLDLGLRLRYEVKREIAPYIGLAWSRDVGETADFTRREGEAASDLSVVAGLRFWR